jgi:hypothetical protein
LLCRNISRIENFVVISSRRHHDMALALSRSYRPRHVGDISVPLHRNLSSVTIIGISGPTNRRQCEDHFVQTRLVRMFRSRFLDLITVHSMRVESRHWPTGWTSCMGSSTTSHSNRTNSITWRKFSFRIPASCRRPIRTIWWTQRNLGTGSAFSLPTHGSTSADGLRAAVWTVVIRDERNVVFCPPWTGRSRNRPFSRHRGDT